VGDGIAASGDAERGEQYSGTGHDGVPHGGKLFSTNPFLSKPFFFLSNKEVPLTLKFFFISPGWDFCFSLSLPLLF
jgi:hypothetical protein